MKIRTVKEGCPLCKNDLKGNRNAKYYCEKCNVLFEGEHVRERIKE